jgi:hypothetical protein
MATAPHSAPVKLAPLKVALERRGIPYTSGRDMVFRGELRVFRSGSRERYARWYIDERELDRLIESRMERFA